MPLRSRIARASLRQSLAGPESIRHHAELSHTLIATVAPFAAPLNANTGPVCSRSGEIAPEASNRPGIPAAPDGTPEATPIQTASAAWSFSCARAAFDAATRLVA